MKVSAIIRSMQSVAEILALAGAEEVSRKCAHLVKALLPASSLTIGRFNEMLNGTDPIKSDVSRRSDNDMTDIRAVFAALRPLIDTVASAANRKDYDAFVRLIADQGGQSLAEFEALVAVAVAPPSSARRPATKRQQPPTTLPVNEKLVANYAKRLEDAMYDPARFAVIMAEIRNDGSIRIQEAHALSSKVVSPVTSSTKKGEALQRIEARHRALAGYKARSEAMGGRSAA